MIGFTYKTFLANNYLNTNNSLYCYHFLLQIKSQISIDKNDHYRN